jgi:hypothetical protein
MNDDELPTPPMGIERPPGDAERPSGRASPSRPLKSPKPDPWNDPFAPLGPEMHSGVFHMQTGRTRRFVFWATVITAGGTLLQTVLSPIAEAIADRIRGPQPVVVVEKDAGR